MGQLPAGCRGSWKRRLRELPSVLGGGALFRDASACATHAPEITPINSWLYQPGLGWTGLFGHSKITKRLAHK